MKKTWKKLLVAGCALSMFLAVPGMTVKAEEYEEKVEIAEEVPDDELQEYEVESENVEEEITDTETDICVSEEELTGAKYLKNDLSVFYDGWNVSNSIQLSFDKDYSYMQEVIISLNGVDSIKNIKVELKNADHVQLSPYQRDTLKNGFNLNEYEHFALALFPKGKGNISGTLSISADGYSAMSIKLSGNSDYYDTDHTFRMVKYVPSSYTLTSFSTNVSGIEGKLPKGVSYIPSTKELYGAPMEKGEFVISLVTSQGTKERATIKVAENDDYYVRNFVSVYGKYWGLDMPGAEEVGMNIYAFMSDAANQDFISGGEYKYLTNVWLNGKILIKGTDYTVSEISGKTKITLKSSVLKNKTNKIKKEDLQGLETGEFLDEALTYANTICAEFNTNPAGNSRGAYMKITPYNFYVVGKTRSVVNEGFSDVQDPNHAFYKAIYWAADAGITKGYPDGTFGIDRSCTRGEMIMFLWRYAGKPSAKALSTSPFKDVPKTHAFYNAIIWASQKGITKGYPDGTFGINRNVSRGECMMFLWRLKGKPAPKAVSVSPFKDVPKTHAFYNAILWGAQKKITNGYTSGAKKGTFGINENCTRGAIVTFLYRAR